MAVPPGLTSGGILRRTVAKSCSAVIPGRHASAGPGIQEPRPHASPLDSGFALLTCAPRNDRNGTAMPDNHCAEFNACQMRAGVAGMSSAAPLGSNKNGLPGRAAARRPGNDVKNLKPRLDAGLLIQLVDVLLDAFGRRVGRGVRLADAVIIATPTVSIVQHEA